MLNFNISEDKQWLILIQSPDEIEKRQLEISLTRKIHNWYFHPLVKKKIWDGNICFIEKRGAFWKIPIGLWGEVLSLGKEYDIHIEINGLDSLVMTDFSIEDFTAWTNKFFEGSKKQPRDYQIEAAWKIIKYKFSVSEIATSSGKTLIAFMVLAYLKDKGLIRKFLMIAPITNLVFQGTDDFIEYGLENLGLKIQQIGGGSKLREGCDVIIGTYQSLVKKDAEFFDEVDAVFIDEAHHTDTMSIKKIVSKCMGSSWRFGLTGTLSKRDSAEHLTIQHYLGPVLVEISPDFLFRNDYATPVEIKIVILDWLDVTIKAKLADLKEKSKADKENKIDGTDIYNIERKLVIESDKRFKFIVNFINRTSKNSLVLFQSVKDEYGKRIWNQLREINGKKEVFYVDGDTDEALREEYKTRMSTGENKVLVATYGTFSTGISIDNLHNIFLVESYKSEVLIKQSLGRGMRLMDGKDKVNVIDFVDDFSFKKNVNHLMKHCGVRMEIYEKEKFKYKVYKVKL